MNFLQSLAQHFAGKPIDWDELEESLIRADLGVPMTMRIIKTLQDREAWSVIGINDVVKVVRQEIARILPANPAPIQPLAAKPKVILLLGVNGTGKTTNWHVICSNIDGPCYSQQQTLFVPQPSNSLAFGPNASALK